MEALRKHLIPAGRYLALPCIIAMLLTQFLGVHLHSEPGGHGAHVHTAQSSHHAPDHHALGDETDLMPAAALLFPAGDLGDAVALVALLLFLISVPCRAWPAHLVRPRNPRSSPPYSSPPSRAPPR